MFRKKNICWIVATSSIATATLWLSSPCSVIATQPEKTADHAADSFEQIDFFEKHVRPLLVNRCQKCHGPEKQWATLRLDSREGLLVGGESGPSIVPGRPEESEILRRIRHSDDEIRMPPPDHGEPLGADQIELLSHWIASGATWPTNAAPVVDHSVAQRNHWAFQPLKGVREFPGEGTSPISSAIDTMVFERLSSRSLEGSNRADNRTLFRRASYDLTGLPPTAGEVDSFCRDESPVAYEQLVDRLLASKAYGEQWGRHWLDVARYSDTKGYVYGREEKTFVHASLYRDWVIDSFNSNMPFDRFVLLQLAADQLVEANAPDLAAMGFLTTGRRFLGVTPDIMDDRIDVVARGLMGLTIACARCHDHKYDPIPTDDYYSLYGVFRNCTERLMPFERRAGIAAPTAEFLTELDNRQKLLRETSNVLRKETSDRNRARIADYLDAQRHLEKYPELGFDQILAKTDLLPAVVRLWQAYLSTDQARTDPIFSVWVSMAELSDEELRQTSGRVIQQLQERGTPVHPQILSACAEPFLSARDIADRYAKVFLDIDASWKTVGLDAEKQNLPAPLSLADPDHESLRQVLYGPRSPFFIPDEPIANIESLFDSDSLTAIWKLQNEVDRWLISQPESAPHALILTDRPYPVDSQIFRRGNPANKGRVVPRQFPGLLSSANRLPFENGSGRLELARGIVSPDNPLTARVWVNRVWMHHFGRGLVETPSDFGLRADPPSHPELLDWLASHLIGDGWNTKNLHRGIMLSKTYQQASGGFVESDRLVAAINIDPNNRLLWRMNPRRLNFEQYRDTLISLAGQLDTSMGGRAVEMFPLGVTSMRRSIYGMVDRQFIPSVMRMFDFANPDLHIPKRSETTVPQQALFSLNHPFVAARSRAAAARLSAPTAETSSGTRVAELFKIILQRDPTALESTSAIAFLLSSETSAIDLKASAQSLAWSYGTCEVDEASGKSKGFVPLPYHTGTAWQGGGQWPDSVLGWAQITATGGHAGNDLAHAAVRRWTAYTRDTVKLSSEAIHDVDQGDGIRCFIISSRHGILKSATLKNSKQLMEIDSIVVEPGDTIDFVVDYNANLNNDQFLWSPLIKGTQAIAAGSSRDSAVDLWNAQVDFTGPLHIYLSPEEQLAQLLLLSNEVMFID